jgi:hypothetical protein
MFMPSTQWLITFSDFIYSGRLIQSVDQCNSYIISDMAILVWCGVERRGEERGEERREEERICY